MNTLSAPVMSIVTVILVLAGAVVTITNPDTLSFQEYLIAVGPLVGLVAIGRGVNENGKHRAGTRRD